MAEHANDLLAVIPSFSFHPSPPEPLLEGEWSYREIFRVARISPPPFIGGHATRRTSTGSRGKVGNAGCQWLPPITSSITAERAARCMTY